MLLDYFLGTTSSCSGLKRPQRCQLKSLIPETKLHIVKACAIQHLFRAQDLIYYL